MSFNEIVKKIALAAWEASTPAAVLFGEVLQVSPLLVKVDSRFELPAELLLVLDHLTLAQGDKVALLRNKGGGQYIVLGRTGANDT